MLNQRPTADFNLLQRLSEKTGGSFATINQLDQLKSQLSESPAKGVIYTDEDYSQLVELRWILLLITGLVAAEWFIRKFSGGY